MKTFSQDSWQQCKNLPDLQSANYTGMSEIILVPIHLIPSFCRREPSFSSVLHYILSYLLKILQELQYSFLTEPSIKYFTVPRQIT
jgi:hypothetical protein